jgi:hypothetical protein
MKNKFYISSVLLSALLFLMVGCARVEVTKIDPKKNADMEGIRFYRSWPYLLVTIDENGKFQTKNIYLPKKNEEYAINVRSGLGTVDASFNLTDGWQLTQFGDKRDSKIPETIGAITGAATSAATTIAKVEIKPPKEVPVPSPGIYRYDFDDNTGFVTGIVPVVLFKDEQK